MTSPSTRIVKTYCVMCTVQCPVDCHLEDGRLVRVAPDLDHPMGGPFCPKAAAAPELVSDPVRLKQPMKRTTPKTANDPGWTPISWDEALDAIAETMLRIRSRDGAEAVAFYRPAPGGSPARDFNAWMTRLAHAFGTPNTAMTTHICNWHRDSGSAYTYGVGMPEADYDNAGTIVIWGSNPHATGVRHVAQIKNAVARGAKLIVIDPRRIPLIARATLWLRVRPSADLALALGLINRIIERELYDETFLTRWTNAPFLIREDTGALLIEADIDANGSTKKYVVWDDARDAPVIYDPADVAFEPETSRPVLEGRWTLAAAGGSRLACTTVFTRLKRIVSSWTPERTSGVTGIPEEAIAEAAETIGTASPVCYYTYNGLEQHTDATQTNRAICILYALTGAFDSKGGMVIFPPMPVEAVTGGDLLPKTTRGRIGIEKRPLGPARGRGRLAGGAVQPYAIYDAITTGEPYPIKALISFGGNMIVSNGDTRRGAEALRQLEFYAHMDCYENPTARFADILLPAASSWESEALGIYNWRERGHVRIRRPAVGREYERRSDLEVIFELAVRLGLGNAFFNGDLDAAFSDQLSRLGVSLADLRASPGGVPVPLPPRYRKYREIDPTSGRPRGFNTPSRLMEIYSQTFAEHGYAPLPDYVDPPEQKVDRKRYPLLLTASKPGVYTHGSYRSIPSLRRLIPEPSLELHPATARARGIEDGKWVALVTPRGSVRARAAFCNDVDPGVVVGQEGWWQACEPLGLPGYDPLSETGANLNLVVGNELIDPISGSVPHRGQPCDVRPL